MADKRARSVKTAPVLQLVFEPADVGALKAVMAGEADEHQQRRAMDWIIKSACGMKEIAYRPGAEGERDTAFMLGRQFVGVSILETARVVIDNQRGG